MSADKRRIKKQIGASVNGLQHTKDNASLSIAWYVCVLVLAPSRPKKNRFCCFSFASLQSVWATRRKERQPTRMKKNITEEKKIKEFAFFVCPSLRPFSLWSAMQQHKEESAFQSEQRFLLIFRVFVWGL